MKKTIVYVDGANLYFGLARPAGVKWLDLMSLSRRLLNAEHEIVRIVYFASRVIDKTADHHKSARQDKYFDALRNRPAIEIVEGRYREQKEKSQPVSEACLACDNRLPDGRVRVFRITEKLTDVNPTFHVRNESQRFARAFVRFLELSNKGLHYTPADAVCAASELTFGGGCAGSVSPSWFKRILTSSFGST